MRPTGSRSRASARSGSGPSASGSTPESGRRRFISRPPRRRSSTSSRARVSRCNWMTTARSRPSRWGPATVSCTLRSSTRTRSAPGPTASRSSRSASVTTPRTRSCRAPASRGSGRPGSVRERRRITRGHARRRSARRRSASLSERPSRIVNEDAVEARGRKGQTVARQVRDLGGAAGSLKTGLSLYDVEPDRLMNPPHCHSEEEEIFVVLSGTGTVELWPHQRAASQPEQFDGTDESFPLRAGRDLRATRGNRSCARGDGRADRVAAAGLRHEATERHHALSAIGQDQLPRRRGHRPRGAGALLGRRGLRIRWQDGGSMRRAAAVNHMRGLKESEGER